MICRKCGKEIQGEEMAFCPYCGARLEETGKGAVSEEAAAWLEKALKVKSLPERKKILEEAKKACPDELEIDWELLFIGTPDPKPRRGVMDFSIIKSWVLQMYRTPGEFSAERKDAMRRELFDSPQLLAVLEASGDPERKLKEYLERLCREYVDIFLKENNQLMGNIFGFRIGRNREKILEDAVDGMIRQIDADNGLTPERKQMLSDAMLRSLKP